MTLGRTRGVGSSLCPAPGLSEVKPSWLSWTAGWGCGVSGHPSPLRDIGKRHVQSMSAVEQVVLRASIALCSQPWDRSAEGQEGCSGGGRPAWGQEAPAHRHGPVTPVLQAEGLGCAHLADKRDFCGEANLPGWVRGSPGSPVPLPGGHKEPSTCETPTPAASRSPSLTPAWLLLRQEELLAHVLPRLPIQDVEDCVPLGEKLHLVGELSSRSVPAPRGRVLAHRELAAC